MKDYEVPLLFAVFLDVLCSWLVFPDLQLHAYELGAPAWVVGLILASFYPAQIAAAPLWAQKSRVFGRKPILIASMLVSAIAMILYGVSGNLLLIWLSRVLAGAAAVNIVLAHSYVHDAATPYDRYSTLGKMGTVAAAGFVAAPAVGGWLSEVGGNGLVGMTASFAYMFAAIWTTVTLPQDEPGEMPNVFRFSIRGLEKILNWDSLKRLIIAAAAGWIAISAFETTFGLLVRKQANLGRLEFGLLLTFCLLTALMVRTYVAKEVKQRYERVGTFKFAYVLLGFGLLLTPFANTLGKFFFFALVIGIAWGLAVPALDVLAEEFTDEHNAAEVERIFRVCRAGAFFIGPILGGLFFDAAPAVTYVVAALLVFTAAAFELLFPERTQQAIEQV